MKINESKISWELLKLMYWWYCMKDKPMKTKDIYKVLGKSCRLTQEEMEERYTNGNNIWNAKIRAARHNVFSKNGIIEVVTRGQWQITQRGVERFEYLQKNLNASLGIEYALMDY